MSILTRDMKTTTITKMSAGKVETTQRPMVRIMSGISWEDRATNVAIRAITKSTNVMLKLSNSNVTGQVSLACKGN